METTYSIEKFEPDTVQTKEPNKLLQFGSRVYRRSKAKIKNFAVGFYHHVESVTLLTLSSFGLSALLGELPFWLTLPWWIEATMVIPFISICLVLALIKAGEFRAKKRLAFA